jgi:asparagine synthase (glutamine-hydrolysing)
MLWTTPESLCEKLPLVQKHLAITADARIDNREELIPALGLKNHPKEKITNSEIILAAYEKWGERSPEKLLGDFAFAIWDQRNQMLFCARDYFGVRPFYYYHCPGRIFTFASEIKSILCLSDVPCHLNEERVGDYLAVMPGDKAITFYRDIFRLPPAHSLRVNFKGIDLRKFWSMDPTFELRLESEQDYAEAYLDVFTKAIHCRLRSTFSIGSALSGGLDSSSIVCIAREYLKQQGKTPLKTFSGVFEQVPDSDERPYISAVVEQGGIEPHYVHADQISPLVELERVLWHQEEPIWTPNLFMHWGLYGAAQQQGVRIFLDGFLGDNVVCHGWEYLMDLAYAWRWMSLFKEIKGVTKRQPGYSQRRMIGQYFWECSLKPRIPYIIRHAWGQWRNAKRSLPRVDAILNPDFAKQINLLQRHQVLQPLIPAPPGAAKQRQYRDLIAGDIPLGLEVANKAAMAFSLESAYPFTDRRLAEFCLATPSSQRVHDGFSRMIVRRALVNHLPGKVCWRADKGDLSYNLRQQLLTFEEDRIDAIIFSNPKPIEDYVDMTALRKTYQNYKKQPASGNIYAVWSAVNLALWLGQPTPSLDTGKRYESKKPDFTLR